MFSIPKGKWEKKRILETLLLACMFDIECNPLLFLLFATENNKHSSDVWGCIIYWAQMPLTPLMTFKENQRQSLGATGKWSGWHHRHVTQAGDVTVVRCLMRSDTVVAFRTTGGGSSDCCDWELAGYYTLKALWNESFADSIFTWMLL